MEIYILRCADGSYYTGVTADLKRRMEAHHKGKGSEYTKLRRPVELVYFEEIDDQKEAKWREVEVKSLSRANKERLIKFGKGVRIIAGSNKENLPRPSSQVIN